MIDASSRGEPYRTAFVNGSQSAIADLPVEKGGNGLGFGPHELLEAALATCMTMTVQMVASERELPLERAGCRVRIDRTIPGAVTLHYSLSLEGPLSGEQTDQLKEAAHRCPVARTLTGAIAISPMEPVHEREG